MIPIADPSFDTDGQYLVTDPSSALAAATSALRIVAGYLSIYERGHGAKRCAEGMRDVAIGALRAIQTPDAARAALDDDAIRRMLAESRAVDDHDTARVCCAALGNPTGDGARGLLDQGTCRARAARLLDGEYAHCK